MNKGEIGNGNLQGTTIIMVYIDHTHKHIIPYFNERNNYNLTKFNLYVTFKHQTEGIHCFSRDQ